MAHTTIIGHVLYAHSGFFIELNLYRNGIGGKMLTRRYIAVFLSVLLPLTAEGCRSNVAAPKSSKPKPKLNIVYSDKKYGTKWINALAGSFKSKYNTDVKLTADSKIAGKAFAMLESGKSEPDLIFTEDTNWEVWAQKGYMEDLTGLFDSAVDGKAIKDKIKPGYLNHCAYNGKYYMMPWNDGVTGFVYNENMFKQYGWQVPSTMDDFFALLDQIKAQGITPIAWSGQNISDWGYVVNGWWAQSAGFDGMQSYLKMDSPEVYAQQGRLTGLQIFDKIVSDKGNSDENVMSLDSSNAVKLFFDSKAAIILSGSWLEAQAGDEMPNGFEMKMMNLPSVSGAKESDINVTGAGDFAFIPSGAKNKKEAESFLKYMACDNMLQLYTKVTSTARPFDYNAADVDGLSDFGESAMQIWQNDKDVYMFSDNPVYYNEFSDWPKDGAPYLQIYLGNETPEQAFNDNYHYARDNWSSAVQKYQVK